ncbi:MAG: flagellar biosynthetic protein FliO [Desulfonatronovibrionaceae bacterium]
MANATDMASSSMSIGLAGMKTASALFLILAGIFLIFFLLRRYGHKAGLSFGQSGVLTHVANLSLGTRKSIVVVRFLNEYLVLGISESRINLLTKIHADHEDEQEFARILEDKASEPADDS